MKQPTVLIPSTTVLQLQLKFTGAALENHRRQNKRPNEKGSALKADVIRFWRNDKDAPLQQVDTSVEGSLAFYVIGVQDEAPYGERYILDAVAVEPLRSTAGITIKVEKDGQPVFSEEKQGIIAGTHMKIFADCDADRGAILRYDIDDENIVCLAKPDFEINDDPQPEDVRPYTFRSMVKESTLLHPNDPDNPQPDPT